MRTLLLLEEQQAQANGNGMVHAGPKKFLSPTQMKEFLVASRKGRYGPRDYCMVLMGYRHGLRRGELITFRRDDVDLEAGHVFVRRQKGSISTSHPMDGEEIRAVRAWLRLREKFVGKNSELLFLSERGPMDVRSFNYLCRAIGNRMKTPTRVNPHMLRHSCGFALADAGKDTRLIQDYLGHKEIKNTEIYTRTSASRFRGLWK